MELLRPEETQLRGSWVLIDHQVLGDPVLRRIEELVAHHLVPLGTADAGWSQLFRDPIDGRYWERSYPQGEMHGGGPACLTAMALEDARQKYDLI